MSGFGEKCSSGSGPGVEKFTVFASDTIRALLLTMRDFESCDISGGEEGGEYHTVYDRGQKL